MLTLLVLALKGVYKTKKYLLMRPIRLKIRQLAWSDPEVD